MKTNRNWGWLLIAVGALLLVLPFILKVRLGIAVSAFLAPSIMEFVFGILLVTGRMPAPRWRTQARAPQSPQAIRIGGFVFLIVGVVMLLMPWIVNVPRSFPVFASTAVIEFVFAALFLSGRITANDPK